MKTQREEKTEAVAPIRVRVIAMDGVYYGNALWRNGQVFEIASMQEFSSRAMEIVPPNTRLSNPMSPKDALDKATRIIRYGRYGLEPPEEREARDSIEVI